MGLRFRHNIAAEGFFPVQVETEGSPEEKMVSAMQMNGYENPTYKFFEATAN